MTYEDIADEFERLFPHHVNTEMRDGVRCAGYDYDETSDIDPAYFTIGRYGDHGSICLPIISIHGDDLQRAGEVLASLDAITWVDGMGQIRHLFRTSGVRFI